jgi:hypothetical protein
MRIIIETDDPLSEKVRREIVPGIGAMGSLLRAERAEHVAALKKIEALNLEIKAAQLHREVAELTLQKLRLEQHKFYHES